MSAKPVKSLYAVSIRKVGPLCWWWNVVGTGKCGYTFNEKRARAKTAKAVVDHYGIPRFEEWSIDHARKIMGMVDSDAL